ncbi:MAG: hypothetical protein KDK89_03915 [Alphaproteobacteria bacterium]|nr:hypothetical protein [Alphaproteobacteria bacterium]
MFPDWDAAIAQTCTVQSGLADAHTLPYLSRFASRFQQHVGTLIMCHAAIAVEALRSFFDNVGYGAGINPGHCCPFQTAWGYVVG